FIRHRINKSEDLRNVLPSEGVEIDLRTSGFQQGEFHLSHDPWKEGEEFRSWLQEFLKRKIKGPLILNTKEDGLEESLIELMESVGITNYLFLDTAFPTLYRYSKTSHAHRFMVRASSVEPIEILKSFKDKVQWVWLDCFEGKPVSLD